MGEGVECSAEVYDFRVEDDLVEMVRRLSCRRCPASCRFPLTVHAEAETRHYELVHTCVRVALPWTASPMELVEFIKGVIRHLSGVSGRVRREREVRRHLAMLIRVVSGLF